MRIGINLLYIIPGNVGGTETYAAGLLYGLSRVDSNNSYIVFVNQEAKAWPIPERPNIKRFVCPVWAKHRTLRYFFEQLILPIILKKISIDLVHSLGYVSPWFTPCASIVTIPDLNFIALKGMIPGFKRIVLRIFSTVSARRASHVITISEFSRKEILRKINIRASKLSVTYLAPKVVNNSTDLNLWDIINKRYRLRQPYIAAFSGGAVHKNILSLVKAFTLLNDLIPHNLVLIGRPQENVKKYLERLEEVERSRIQVLGYVEDEEILPILNHAELFITPSLYEGFGIPVLEAQQAGVPVLSSNAGSLPEVAGEGVMLFNPYSIDEIAQTIQSCCLSPRIRTMLIEKGFENLKRFSWETTARETLAIYLNHG